MLAGLDATAALLLPNARATWHVQVHVQKHPPPWSLTHGGGGKGETLGKVSPLGGGKGETAPRPVQVHVHLHPSSLSCAQWACLR